MQEKMGHEMVEHQPGEEAEVSNPAVRTVQIVKDILVLKLLSMQPACVTIPILP